MDIKKRLFRKPLVTALWAIILTVAATLLCIGVSLWYSAYRLPAVLDEQQTTIAVMTSRYIKEDNGVTYTPVALYDDDIASILAIPCVKGIDFRTLSGAYIEKLEARIGLIRSTYTMQNVDWSSPWNANSTYNKVILAGTVERVWEENPSPDITADLTKFGGTDNMNPNLACALLKIDEAKVIASDYPLFETEGYDDYDGRIRVMFNVYSDGTNFFQEGKRYVIQGQYDPMCSAISYVGKFDETIPMRPILQGAINLRSSAMDALVCKDNSLILYQNSEVDEKHDLDNGSIHKVVTSLDDGMPVAAEWNGSIDELIEHDSAWAKTVDEYEMTLHSFPVLGTDNLKSMYLFVKNMATVSDGRFFTKEEYERGEKVVILNREIAQRAGVSVGDEITINQFKAANSKEYGNYSYSWDSADYDMLMLFNNPALGFDAFSLDKPHEAENFTVVGLYTLENEWENSAFSFTPNTVFIPKKAQIIGASGGMSKNLGIIQKEGYVLDESGNLVKQIFEFETVDYGGVQGVYMSVILENGKMDEFLECVKNDKHLSFITTLNNDGFLTFDQGYDRARAGIDALKGSAGKLMLICMISAAMLFILFIVLYQGSERRNLGILRSVGTQVCSTRKYLFISGLILIVLGAVAGILISYLLSGAIESKLIDFTIAQTKQSAHSGGANLDAETLFGIVKTGNLPLGLIALIGCAGAFIAAVCTFTHTAILSKKKPRKLLGV